MASIDGYKGRKAPNVSHFLANLNALPSAHDLATQQHDDFTIDDDLAQFTNTDFLDFDQAEFIDQQMHEYDHSLEEKARRENAAANSRLSGKNMDYVIGDYHFPSIDFPNTPPNGLTAPLQTQYANTTGLPQAIYPPPTNNTTTSPLTYDPSSFNPTPYPGQKHHLTPPPSHTTTSHSPPSSSTEPETPAARLAAEEDKRRRNTAASARFRVKKKQREQALEHTAKELENKARQLEQRVGRLETENEWLRGLVVEKNGGAKEDLKVRWEKYGGPGERRGGAAKKGVGTEGTAEEKGKNKEDA